MIIFVSVFTIVMVGINPAKAGMKIFDKTPEEEALTRKAEPGERVDEGNGDIQDNEDVRQYKSGRLYRFGNA